MSDEIGDADPPAGHDEDPAPHAEAVRRMLPWPKVLGLMVGALAVWLLFDATTLQHNAEVSPVGTRRTVALTVLRPIATTSRFLQISRLESTANGLLGRNGNVPGHGRVIVVTAPPHTKTSKATPGVTTTTLNPLAHPSAANPVRILLIGDSLGLDLGGSLQNALASTGVVTATLDGKESTGLTRPDYFNWPAALASDLNSSNPQVVVVMMGANDPQDFLGPPDVPFGTAAWNQEYLDKSVQFMQEATSRGAKLVWVSLPPMQDARLNAKIATINSLQRQAASQVPGVVYVDSSPVLGSTAGGYSAFVTVNGQVINVRTPDGIHMTPSGGSLLADTVIQALRSRLGIPLP